MPSRAETHIQNTAPGPPNQMAVATPAMLPVPMVEARAVARAWNWEIPRPFPRPRRRSMAPKVVRSHRGMRKIWKKPVRRE